MPLTVVRAWEPVQSSHRCSSSMAERRSIPRLSKDALRIGVPSRGERRRRNTGQGVEERRDVAFVLVVPVTGANRPYTDNDNGDHAAVRSIFLSTVITVAVVIVIVVSVTWSA